MSDYQGTNQAFVQLGDDTVDWTLGDGTTNVVNVDLSGLPGDSALRIEGSDRFKQRILQDLAMLRSSPDGRKMLLAMDDIHEDTKAIAADWPILGGVAYQGDTITIREYPGDDNSTSSYRGAPFDLWRSNEIKQSRSITELYPGTEAAWQETPPVVVLFHGSTSLPTSTTTATRQGSRVTTTDPTILACPTGSGRRSGCR